MMTVEMPFSISELFAIPFIDTLILPLASIGKPKTSTTISSQTSILSVKPIVNSGAILLILTDFDSFISLYLLSPAYLTLTSYVPSVKF